MRLYENIPRESYIKGDYLPFISAFRYIQQAYRGPEGGGFDNMHDDMQINVEIECKSVASLSLKVKWGP